MSWSRQHPFRADKARNKSNDCSIVGTMPNNVWEEKKLPKEWTQSLVIPLPN
ncbi:hypothetical protein DPMN_112406 [Dreissena polymorpha]|uniref:Uncharacterized protein n=1 Tax=Dreissena polymorpha TaxID=45954 RepID=A0A9D4KFM8_DREPO|nr:hypothetical protein DPMN_112406 [Dreissena polymorpha]